MLTDLLNLYSRWPKPVCQRAKPADNELTTKSQLLSSNRVIASAMLSIPVQACEGKKTKKNELHERKALYEILLVCFMKRSDLPEHKKHILQQKEEKA